MVDFVMRESSLKEGQDMVRVIRSTSAPGPNKVPKTVYKQYPHLLHHRWKILWVIWHGRRVTIIVLKELYVLPKCTTCQTAIMMHTTQISNRWNKAKKYKIILDKALYSGIVLQTQSGCQLSSSIKRKWSNFKRCKPKSKNACCCCFLHTWLAFVARYWLYKYQTMQCSYISARLWCRIC